LAKFGTYRIRIRKKQMAYTWFSFTNEERDWCVKKRWNATLRIVDVDRQRGRTAHRRVSAVLDNSHNVVTHPAGHQHKQRLIRSFPLFPFFTRWHVPPSRTSAEAFLTGWPNARPQEWDKCSVARHHQACLTVCVKCRCCATSLFLRKRCV